MSYQRHQVEPNPNRQLMGAPLESPDGLPDRMSISVNPLAFYRLASVFNTDLTMC